MSTEATHYGRLTRYLHWAMAALFAWQFASAGAHAWLEDTTVEAFLWASHKPLGLLLMLLAIVRVAWGIFDRGHRPPAVNAWASLGHLALYLLMIAVPAVALIRQYGSGRAFEPFGIPLMSGFEGEIEWMTAIGSNFHGLFGWVLLALVVGHVAMALWHRHAGDSAVMSRMTGRETN